MNKRLCVNLGYALFGMVLLGVSLLANGFVYSVEGGQNQTLGTPIIWRTLPIVMNLNLGDSNSALINGTDNWDVNAEDALAEWNTVSDFFTMDSRAVNQCDRNNAVNSVAWDDNNCGDGFGDAIAVTRQIFRSRNNGPFEYSNADVLFNSNLCWNAYSGPIRRCGGGGDLFDLRRVALHEFGHVLGLGHPDQGGQSVNAIMNSKVSNTDTLTQDDRTGAATIYDVEAAIQSAKLINISTRALVGQGDNVLIAGFIIGGNTSKTVVVRALGSSLQNQGVSGVLSDPTLELLSGQTVMAFNDDWTQQVPAAFRPQDSRESALVATLNPGPYTAIVRGLNGSTGISLVEVYELDTTQSAILSNVSTRAFVGNGDNVLIGGFVIEGNAPKRVVIRAVGGSLTDAGVSGALPDPTLELFSGSTSIAFNDNWAAPIPALFQPSNNLESALDITLDPGAYTAIVRGLNGSNGVALIEVYDLEQF